MSLTTDEIKAVSDIEISKPIHIARWRGDVYIRSLDADEWTAFERTARDSPDEATLELVIASACDESGNCLFGLSDKEWLRKKNGQAVMTIANVAVEWNGLSDFNVKELEKN